MWRNPRLGSPGRTKLRKANDGGACRAPASAPACLDAVLCELTGGKEGGEPGLGRTGVGSSRKRGGESHDRGPSYRSQGGRREPTAASDPRGGPRTALRKAKVKVQELEGEEREGQKRAGRGCAHHSGKAGHARESASTTGKPFPGPGAQAASARRLVWGRSVRFGQPSPRHEASRSTELASRGL